MKPFVYSTQTSRIIFGAGSLARLPAELEILGISKALVLTTPQPVALGEPVAALLGARSVAVPTTYASSEMTPNYGQTEGRLKKTGRDLRVLPRSAIYDPDLTLPRSMSITSDMNAIAHADEGLSAHDGSPIIALMAEEAIRALAYNAPGKALHAHDPTTTTTATATARRNCEPARVRH